VACSDDAKLPSDTGAAAITGGVGIGEAGSGPAPAAISGNGGAGRGLTAGTGGVTAWGAAETVAGASAAGGGGSPASASGGATGTAGNAGSRAGAGSAAVAGAAGTASGGDCAGDNLLAIPDDVGARGPWDVGVRTVQIGTRLTTEIFYPAEPGSTAGKPEAKYDLRQWLPMEDRAKVPADHSPLVGPFGGHLFRDVPIDAAHGLYPVIIFIHGTASMRIASSTLNTHWASRGFVVVAADYPSLGLADKLNEACSRPTPAQDIPADVNAQLDALNAGSDELSFLKGHIDMKRLGVSGHSQGGCVSAELTSLPGVQISIPLSGSMPNATASLKSLMYISGISDQVIGYDAPLIGNVVCSLGASSSKGAYTDSIVMGPKRLIGITGGGHLVPTDLCQDNAQGRNAIEEAQLDGVCGIDTAVIIGIPALFDCGTIELKAGLDAVIYPSTAALEETLHCMDRKNAFADMRTKLPQIGEFEHTP
jgi:dienelactone hydrolase